MLHRFKSAAVHKVGPKELAALNEEMGSTGDEENVSPQDNIGNNLQDKLPYREIKSRIQTTSNKPTLTKTQLEEQKQKWREERHSRLMSRLAYKRHPMETFSSAVFGFKSNTSNGVAKRHTNVQSVAAKPSISSSMTRSNIAQKTIIDNASNEVAKRHTNVHSVAAKRSISSSMTRRTIAQKTIIDKKINQSCTNIKSKLVVTKQPATNISEKMNKTTIGAETAKSRLIIRQTLASQLRMAKVAPQLETSRKVSNTRAGSGSANTAEGSKKESVYERLFKAVPKRVTDNKVKPIKLSTTRPPFNSSVRSVSKKKQPLSAPIALNASIPRATLNSASSRKVMHHVKPITAPHQAKPSFKLPSANNLKKPTAVKPLPVAKKIDVQAMFKPSSSSQPLRRSLSTVHVQHLGRKEASRRIIRRSISVPCIPELDEKDSPILNEFEETQDERDGVPQHTRSESHRHSKSTSFFAPIETAKTPSYTPLSSQPHLLRRNLAQWLDKQGKPIDTFRHLHCFGCSAAEVKQQLRLMHFARERATPQSTPRRSLKKRVSACSPVNKSFPEQPPILPSGDDYSVESLDCTRNRSQNLTYSLTEDSEVEESLVNDPIASTPNVTLEKQGPSVGPKFDGDWNMILGEALSDLCTLIQSGYPRDECEGWLMLVHKQCHKASQLPLFWECFAALEEARGNFNSAINCYERAIEHGAQVDAINEALNQLMKKFSTLNVKSGAAGDGKPHSKTPHKYVDRKNEFKSSAIKFTLEEKAEKNRLGFSVCKDALEMTSHFVATPVRRSTRLFRGHFSTTPRIRCVNTLGELELSERKSLIFHSNTALESRL